MREVDGVEEDKDEQDTGLTDAAEREEDEEEVVPPEPTPMQVECAKARSVLNANIAACHVKLVSSMPLHVIIAEVTFWYQGEHEDVVKACTEGTQ